MGTRVHRVWIGGTAILMGITTSALCLGIQADGDDLATDDVWAIAWQGYYEYQFV